VNEYLQNCDFAVLQLFMILKPNIEWLI